MSLLNPIRWLALAPLFLLLGACATLRIDPEQRPESFALAGTDNTTLGRSIGQKLSLHPGLSGFLLLTKGSQALSGRIRLCRLAERSIDLQYYLWNRDPAGRALAVELVRAADRGVRVRILLDDIFEAGRDIQVAQFSSHPNIEVRYFNPKKTRGKFAPFRQLTEVAFRFGQINRRMHNKIFAVDNQVAIVGGRNIGAEYFDAGEDFNFFDTEVVAVGPIVPRVSNSFDEYWNSPKAYPVAALANAKKVGSFEDLREKGFFSPLAMEEPTHAIERVMPEFHWARAELVYDDPGKVTDPDLYQSRVLPALENLVKVTEQEVLLQSAYFIPTKQGARGLINLASGDVKIRVSTNSLASNNHAIAHSGYAKYRKRLLEGGVELYELKPRRSDADGIWGLHSKVAVFDRKVAFVGTFNLDPRSAALNTEMALIIHSPELATKLAANIDRQISPAGSWQLSLDTKGRLVWKGEKKRSEPQASLGARISSFFMGLLPIENQL